MSAFVSLVSVHLAGEGKIKISLDTLPGDAGVIQSFRLNDYLNLTTRGVYRVSSKGKLPSSVELGKEVEFETPPLILKIESPDSKRGTSTPNR